MIVEITTPKDYVRDIVQDLNSRRGLIQDTNPRGGAQIIIAMVPLAQMFRYGNALMSMAEGRATFEMTYDHYEAIPQGVSPDEPPDDLFPAAMAMRA